MDSDETSASIALNEKKQSTEKRALLPAMLSNITVVAAFLYLIGFSYDQGYIDTYGISSEFFPRSTQEYLIRSFYAFMYIVNEFIGGFHLTIKPTLIAAAIVFALSFLVIAIPYPKWLIKFENETKKFISNRTGKLIVIPLFSAFVTLFIPIFIVSALLTSTIPSLSPFLIGRNSAQKEISNFKECKVDSKIEIERNRVSLIENNKIIAEGILVAKSQNYVAIYNKTTKIYPLKEQTFEMAAKRIENKNLTKN